MNCKVIRIMKYDLLKVTVREKLHYKTYNNTFNVFQASYSNQLCDNVYLITSWYFDHFKSPTL